MRENNINQGERPDFCKELDAQILYEDNHLLVVNKRPSQIVQGDKTGDVPLSEMLKTWVKYKYNKPGAAFLGVAHRLDRPVSGVVIFARTSKALERINLMLHDKKMKKRYLAVVKNMPPKEEDHLRHYMIKNEAKNKSACFEEPQPGSKHAELKYKHIASSDNYHLLEVELLTGRHHQIRAQLAAIGCPIKGDLKYGFARSNADASIHLHAWKVEILHPVRQEIMTFEAPLPDDAIWNYFKDKL